MRTRAPDHPRRPGLIDHPPGAHDDAANAVAGVLTELIGGGVHFPAWGAFEHARREAEAIKRREDNGSSDYNPAIDRGPAVASTGDVAEGRAGLTRSRRSGRARWFSAGQADFCGRSGRVASATAGASMMWWRTSSRVDPEAPNLPNGAGRVLEGSCAAIANLTVFDRETQRPDGGATNPDGRNQHVKEVNVYEIHMTSQQPESHRQHHLVRRRSRFNSRRRRRKCRGAAAPGSPRSPQRFRSCGRRPPQWRPRRSRRGGSMQSSPKPETSINSCGPCC